MTGCDSDVIEENQYKLTEERLQHSVHEPLERRWCIGEAERHDQKLKVTMVTMEGYLLDVSRVHLDLMVARTEIQFL